MTVNVSMWKLDKNERKSWQAQKRKSYIFTHRSLSAYSFLVLNLNEKRNFKVSYRNHLGYNKYNKRLQCLCIFN